MLPARAAPAAVPRPALRRARSAAPRFSVAAMASAAPSVVVAGEALWDGLPGGLFLGGAPCNVGVHCTQLGRRAAAATRVGRDQLGEEICDRLAARGVDTSLIQFDDKHRTGFVKVTMAGSEPTYDIVKASAWDFLEPSEALLAASAAADAVVFGSLAQREAGARETIRKLRAGAKRTVFDVNLRPPFIFPDVVQESAQGVWLLKLNEEEAVKLCEWAKLSAGGNAGDMARALGERFGCQGVVVTCGGDGAALWRREGNTLVTHAGCKVTAVDAVGAGDAFLASLLDGLLKGEDAAKVLARANAVGAFVATQHGATPPLDAAAIQALMAASPPAVHA